jgi:hypothetical protein
MLGDSSPVSFTRTTLYLSWELMGHPESLLVRSAGIAGSGVADDRDSERSEQRARENRDAITNDNEFSPWTINAEERQHTYLAYALISGGGQRLRTILRRVCTYVPVDESLATSSNLSIKEVRGVNYWSQISGGQTLLA